MRNVKRPTIPVVLNRNAAKWTTNLLNEIKSAKASGRKVDRNFYNKYNHKDIKKVLITMYNGYCCYCEFPTGVFEWGHIEHRKPTSKYPKYAFDWDNLHLSCTMCNELKSSKYNTTNSILDAVTDVPIADHLLYTLNYREPQSKKGETTEQHADLNREDLLEFRAILFKAVMELIEKINRNQNNPRNGVRKLRLKRMCKEYFGSMVEYLMDTFIKS